MASIQHLPTRQIHLDFHTGPHIPDVGRDFDAKEFARVMKEARVNSVTVFAKCHHGHLYYNTRHPARHPHLKKNLDLLGEQVEALHSAGIRAPIYLSVQCDEYAADNYPEWLVINPDAAPEKRKSKRFEAGWQIVDMSSPYQEYLLEQTLEVLKLFKPVDGIFYDMCWDQQSVSKWSIAGMKKMKLNPEIESDRAKYAHKVAIDYMKRYSKVVRDHTPDAGVYFNSRPLSNLKEEAPIMTQVEIEALPTGGWGYMYFPINVRFARNFGKPYLGMTARFHKSWADFGGLKPYAALEYETSQMMAHGASCSVGDQLHPRGTTDVATYQMIGKVYSRVEAREPWLLDAKPVTQVAVYHTRGEVYALDSGSSDEGVVRMLSQLNQQFDLIHADSLIDQYDLVILPDRIKVDAKLTKKLDAFLKKGKAVIASHLSGLNESGTEKIWTALPVAAEGPSPYKTTYARFAKAFEQDVPPSDHVIYDRTTRVTASKGSESLLTVVEPYFERTWDHFCSHFQTPTDRASKYSLVTQKGKLAYVAFPIFASFAAHGNYPLRLLVKNLLHRLLPEPLLRVAGPTSLETTVTKQGDRTIVHLLYYPAERKTKVLDLIEDIVPLYDLPLSLRMKRAPKQVYLAPERKAIEFEYLAGRVNLRVPAIHGHAMVVFE